MITPTHVFRPVHFGKPKGSFFRATYPVERKAAQRTSSGTWKVTQSCAPSPGCSNTRYLLKCKILAALPAPQIARLTNETVFHVGSILENQRRAGLYVVWGGGYHLTDDAMVMASKVDGVPASALRTALRAYLPTDSSHRDRNKLHDRDVVDLVIECKGDGMEVAGPKRGIVYMSPSVQVKPDAVIGFSRPGEVLRWAFLELERGKRTPAGDPPKSRSVPQTERCRVQRASPGCVHE